MGSRWYTSDFQVVITVVLASAAPFRGGLYPGLEEMGIKCLQPGGCGLLHFGVCGKSEPQSFVAVNTATTVRKSAVA